MGSMVTSDNITCGGHLPKYVFVLSLENRSFDHVYGRSGITGKDADTGKDTAVNGVLNADGSINTSLNNVYNGQTWPVPNVDAAYIMPGDPKHEYEHILDQCCGGTAVSDLLQHYKGWPDSFGFEVPKNYYENAPFPGQSSPYWVKCLNVPGGKSYTKEADFKPPATNNSGFIHSWVKSYTTNVKHSEDATAGTPANIDEVMRCFDTKKQLPMLYALAKEFAICDNFFSSLPGPTGPNRFFMMGASSGGYDHSPSSGELIAWQATGVNARHVPMANGNLFTRLGDLGVSWQVFGDDNFPMAAVCEGVHTGLVPRVHGTFADQLTPFTAHAYPTLQYLLTSSLAPSKYPYSFTWIEPDFDTTNATARNKIPFNDHPTYSGGNSMHPCSDVRKCEELVRDVYSWIRGNKEVWENCVLFITWDEHGGFYDHVVPPTNCPKPGDSGFSDKWGENANQWGFQFDKFGFRVPCLVISPLIAKNQIDHAQYDHTSIIQTVRDLYNSGAFTNGVRPTGAKVFNNFTNRDAKAAPMTKLFTLATARDADKPMPIPALQHVGDGQTEPATKPLDAAAAKTAQNEPISGNMATHVAVAMNQYAAITPGFDPTAAMKDIKTMGDAYGFLAKANVAIDDHRSNGNQQAAA